MMLGTTRGDLFFLESTQSCMPSVEMVRASEHAFWIVVLKYLSLKIFVPSYELLFRTPKQV